MAVATASAVGIDWAESDIPIERETLKVWGRIETPEKSERAEMEHNMNLTSTIDVSDAALAAVANLARLSDGERAAALRMLGITRGTRVWTPRGASELPTLTGLVPERDRETIYASATWAAAYRPARAVVAYVAQARGLARLSMGLGGHSLAKVGTTAAENVERRLAELGAAEYGALHRGAQGYEREPGFDLFVPPPRLQLKPQHPGSPVRLTRFGVAVGLPRSLSAGEFEAEFNRRLAPLRLQNVAEGDAGRGLCARSGLEPTEMLRFYRTRNTVTAATELTLMRPQADVGALARLCADVVIDRTLGLLPKRPVQ